MKKWWSIALILTLLLPASAAAAPADFTGGVNDEYEYKELVFVSGQPLVFSGKMTVNDSTRNDSRSLRYTFKLTSDDPGAGGELTRNMSYLITYDTRADKGQTVSQVELRTYKENITIGGDEYDLDDLRFSKSDIIDNRAASDFYSGTMTAKKIYTINDDEGRVTVEMNGGSVGYENFWGLTETQLLDFYITSTRSVAGEAGGDNIENDYWEGTVNVIVTDSLAKALRYSANESSLSSFSGGNLKVTEESLYSRYDYDLPRLTTNGNGTIARPDGNRRNQGAQELRKDKMPLVERLILPKFRDVGGHWAQDAINQLYSCDVFTGDTTFFAPDVPITRGDFTAAVVRVCDIRATTGNQRTTRSRKVVEVSPFADVPTTDADYAAIKVAVDKGLVSGVGDGIFGKDSYLTRAQAVTILVRALGFENQAPTPGYYSGFADDGSIQSWAKDSVYMGRQIGLVTGDAYNRFNPDQALTRAEASVLLVKFLSFLQSDLQQDYRDHIVLYR